jgi:chromosome segregation ATPase
MSSEEDKATFATKGQLKILIERIRHIENQQIKLESEFSIVTKNQEKFVSEISNALNSVKEITSEFNSYKPDLGKMKDDFKALNTRLDDLNNDIDSTRSNLTSDLITLKAEINLEMSNLKQSMGKGEEFQTKLINQVKALQEKFTQLEGAIAETDMISKPHFENHKEEMEKALGDVQLRFDGISKRFENVENMLGSQAEHYWKPVSIVEECYENMLENYSVSIRLIYLYLKV